MQGYGVINSYRKYLPVTDKTPVITLQEGNTPLIKAQQLPELVFANKLEIYFKYEGLNPTGSFKDRGMTVAISKAKEEGSTAVICASTGNTSASAAAYSARGNMRCIVLIPNKNIALGKLTQALIHNADVLAVEGNFDSAFNIVKEIANQYPITLVNSVNPYRIEGQKTGAFEICDVLGEAPTFQAMPVGNAGNISAYWKGYKEYKQDGKVKNLPIMLGFQAAGAAPIVKGKIIPNPETIATAIRIGNPASWKTAVAARDESKGTISAVTDKEILSAYRLLACKEGIFAEPASCASVAGIIKLQQNKFFDKYFSKNKKIKIVCILTGHGLKDPGRVLKVIKEPKVIKPDFKSIVKFLKIK